MEELFSPIPLNWFYSSIARSAVRQRFGPSKVERNDMLGSFIRRGLSQSDAEANAILQLLVQSSSAPFRA